MIKLYLGWNHGTFNSTEWEHYLTFNNLLEFNKHMMRIYKLDFKDIIDFNNSLQLNKILINSQLSNTWIKVK